MAKKPEKKPVRPAASDALSGRVESSGLIRAGAKPQFERPTPLDRTVAAAKRLGAKMRGKKGK